MTKPKKVTKKTKPTKKDTQQSNRMKVDVKTTSNKQPVFLACPKCHHVHYSVSRAEAERQVKVFNNYFNTLTIQERHEYYGNTPSSVSSYESCFICSISYKEFVLPTKSIVGQTVQPIIDREE